MNINENIKVPQLPENPAARGTESKKMYKAQMVLLSLKRQQSGSRVSSTRSQLFPLLRGLSFTKLMRRSCSIIHPSAESC